MTADYDGLVITDREGLLIITALFAFPAAMLCTAALLARAAVRTIRPKARP